VKDEGDIIPLFEKANNNSPLLERGARGDLKQIHPHPPFIKEGVKRKESVPLFI